MYQKNGLIRIVLLAQTKMSWRGPLTSQHFRQPLGIKGQSCSSATMIPQMTVVADLTCSEDEWSLKPGEVVGDCHARRLPSGA